MFVYFLNVFHSCFAGLSTLWFIWHFPSSLSFLFPKNNIIRGTSWKNTTIWSSNCKFWLYPVKNPMKSWIYKTLWPNITCFDFYLATNSQRWMLFLCSFGWDENNQWKILKSCWNHPWTLEMSFLGLVYQKECHASFMPSSTNSTLHKSLKEEKLTFFVSSEELQLFLLLPPQCVDYSDGQSECFLGVAMWSQGIHSGTRSGDVFCRRGDGKGRDILMSTLYFFLWMKCVFPLNHVSPLSHRATEATLGRRRGSCRGCNCNSSWCSGPQWWCAAGGGPASAGRRPRSPAWTPSCEAASVNLPGTNTRCRTLKTPRIEKKIDSTTNRGPLQTKQQQ